MRQAIGLFGAALSVAIASAAPAQQLVHRVGEQYVFVLADPSLVDPMFLGERLYFPVAEPRRAALRVYIGSAAVCVGEYTDIPPAGAVSVEGRAVRLEQSEATFINNHGVYSRHPINIFVMDDCTFGSPDLEILSTMRAGDEIEDAREDAERSKEVEDFLRSEHEACLEYLAGKNMSPSPEAIRAWC